MWRLVGQSQRWEKFEFVLSSYYMNFQNNLLNIHSKDPTNFSLLLEYCLPDFLYVCPISFLSLLGFLYLHLKQQTKQEKHTINSNFLPNVSATTRKIRRSESCSWICGPELISWYRMMALLSVQFKKCLH